MPALACLGGRLLLLGKALLRRSQPPRPRRGPGAHPVARTRTRACCVPTASPVPARAPALAPAPLLSPASCPRPLPLPPHVLLPLLGLGARSGAVAGTPQAASPGAARAGTASPARPSAAPWVGPPAGACGPEGGARWPGPTPSPNGRLPAGVFNSSCQVLIYGVNSNGKMRPRSPPNNHFEFITPTPAGFWLDQRIVTWKCYANKINIKMLAAPSSSTRFLSWH